jgi:sugar phosphate isomerase/epimerase
LENIAPNIFIEPDLYGARMAGPDPATILVELGLRALLVHIKDSPATHHDPVLPLGSGVFDFPAIVRADGESTEWTVVQLDEVTMDALEAVAQSCRYVVRQQLRERDAAISSTGITAQKRNASSLRVSRNAYDIQSVR